MVIICRHNASFTLPLQAQTPGGILLPESVKEKPQIGEIRGVGPGGMDEKGNKTTVVVKVGQKVMYKKWGGNEIKIDGEEWTLVGQEDILAIVN